VVAWLAAQRPAGATTAPLPAMTNFFFRRAAVSEQGTPGGQQERAGCFPTAVLRQAGHGLLNGLAAVVLATPVVGYLLAPIVRGKADATASGSTGRTGRISRGPDAAGEVQESLSRIPGTARPTTFLAGSAASRARRFRSSLSTALIWAVPVRWFPQSGLFMCPCHGGVYYQDGSRASGPPPRGLFEYPYKVENGRLMIEAGQLPTLSTSASLYRGARDVKASRKSATGSSSG
jgi:menaquinol-cytochrome c reductase iron-sulfur subunit